MKLTISRKLMGSFLLIAILLGITSGISYYYLDKVDVLDTDLIERRAVIMSNAQKMQVEAAKQSGRLRGYLLMKDAEFLDGLRASNENMTNLINETNKLVHLPEDQERLKKLDSLNKELKQKYDQLLQMLDTGQPNDEVMDFYKNIVLPLGRQLDPVTDEMANAQFKRMDEGSKTITDSVNTAIANISILAVISFPLAILIALFISRNISKPIVHMANVAEQIARGDLTSEDIRVMNKDEIGALAKSFNQMKENLRYLIAQVNLSAEQLAASAQELTASAEQTSQASETITSTIQEVVVSTEKQARSVSESVQSINEMSSGVQQIAANSQLTSNLSGQASQQAQKGHQAIQLAVNQMDLIDVTMNQLASVVKAMEDHSKEIEQIVEVITGIASQTNLLALNAAIEAARAGEHGRGFAVVADEVRNLAEQSSVSAGQITQLIANIQSQTHEAVQSMEAGTKEVGKGIEVVNSAGKLFEEIKHDVDEVANQIHEISVVSEQISASAVQVVHAVDIISEESNTVVAESQNVSTASEEQLASMEEISASASSLSRMAEELQMAIGKFKV